MKTKTKIMITSLGALLVIGAAVLATHTYVCQLGGQCTYTKYGVSLQYPHSWKAKESANKSTLLQDPKKRAPVGLGFVSEFSNGQGTATGTTSEMLLSAQPLPKMSNAWDVRVVGEYKDNYTDTFTPFEMVVSTESYRQIDLVQGKMVPLANARYVPNLLVAGKRIAMGTFDQDPLITSFKVAKAWFALPEEIQAHKILLSAQPATK